MRNKFIHNHWQVVKQNYNIVHNWLTLHELIKIKLPLNVAIDWHIAKKFYF